MVSNGSDNDTRGGKGKRRIIARAVSSKKDHVTDVLETNIGAELAVDTVALVVTEDDLDGAAALLRRAHVVSGGTGACALTRGNGRRTPGGGRTVTALATGVAGGLLRANLANKFLHLSEFVLTDVLEMVNLRLDLPNILLNKGDSLHYRILRNGDDMDWIGSD